MKLEGLDTLVNLEELYLADNGIEKIEGLDNNVSSVFFIYLLSNLLYFFYFLYIHHPVSILEMQN